MGPRLLSDVKGGSRPPWLSPDIVMKSTQTSKSKMASTPESESQDSGLGDDYPDSSPSSSQESACTSMEIECNDDEVDSCSNVDAYHTSNNTVSYYKVNWLKPKPANEQSKAIAMQLAVFIVRHFAFGKSSTFSLGPSQLSTLQRTVEEISTRHHILFRRMMERCEITKDSYRESFENIIQEMFHDDQVNWGRIVSVYALGGHMAKYLADHRHPECVEDLGELVGSTVANRLCWWVDMEGGWEKFDEYFPDPNAFESGMWRMGLMWATLGIGALATFALVR